MLLILRVGQEAASNWRSELFIFIFNTGSFWFFQQSAKCSNKKSCRQKEILWLSLSLKAPEWAETLQHVCEDRSLDFPDFKSRINQDCRLWTHVDSSGLMWTGANDWWHQQTADIRAFVESSEKQFLNRLLLSHGDILFPLIRFYFSFNKIAVLCWSGWELSVFSCCFFSSFILKRWVSIFFMTYVP